MVPVVGIKDELRGKPVLRVSLFTLASLQFSTLCFLSWAANAADVEERTKTAKRNVVIKVRWALILREFTL